jgi:hypothetical protein
MTDDDPDRSPPPATAAPTEAPSDLEPRPWLERLGLAGIAVVMAVLFGVTALAFWAGGEWILGAMSAAGALVTIAVGLSNLVRG